MIVLAGLLVAVVVVPHVLRLQRTDPATASLLWAANLGLRAVLGLLVALYLVLYVPASGAFSSLTHWCWHAVVPLVSTHVGLSGHGVGDLAALLPVLALVVSLGSVAVGLLRVARSVHRLLARGTLGRGPAGSVIVGGSQVVLAAAGLARPRIVVSAGALVALDEAELAAGLDHERGHIVRRHRWVLLYAELCRALAVLVPGTRAGVRQLALHLERDADRWALARRHDRLALAGAIVKAAGAGTAPAIGLAGLGGGAGQLARRVEDLVQARPELPLPRRALRAVALASCVAALGLAAAVPPTLAEGIERPAIAAGHACPA